MRKRIVNKALLKEYTTKKCSVLNCYADNVCAHHIKTKGSGGDDSESNLMALCQVHHIQVHTIGLNKFTQNYPEIISLLKQKGWSKLQNRWKRLLN